MRVLVLLGWVMTALLVSGCAEPNASVTRSTQDELFEVRLKAAKNHLKPSEVLPILVTVESVGGQLATTIRDTIDFIANEGSVSPSRLVVTFVGIDDSLTTGVIDTYSDWITFTLDSRAESDRQGEVHALFRSLNTTLKIRVVED